MDGDISLLAIYDRVAQVDTKVETLTARVDEQLAHTQRTADDHETRIRRLESAADQHRGMSATLTLVLSLAGSGTTSAVISWLLTRH